jgi:hypothetical protein
MLGAMDVGGVVIPPTGKIFEQDWVAVLTFEGAQISVNDELYDNHGTLIHPANGSFSPPTASGLTARR